jgi:outer membrane protein
MKTLLALLTLCIVGIIGTNTASAQNLKLGFVDTEIILKQLPDALEADKKLKEIGMKYQDTLRKFEEDFKAKIESYKKQEAMMTADAKKKEEESLKSLQQTALAYQEDKFGQQGEIIRLRETFMTPIREKILVTIKEVAKEEKMSFVFDKTNPSLLYAEEKFDITFKVIDKIKRK